MEPSLQPKLPVTQLMKLAWSQVVKERVALIQGCAAPVALSAFTNFPGFGGLWPLMLVGQLVAAALFSVTCHRILLLGPGSIPNEWGLYFTKRELRYLVYTLVAAIGASVLLSPIVAMGFLGVGGLPWMFFWIAGCVGVAYGFARFSLIFPGLAVDQAWTLRASWWITRRHAWRLAWLFFATGIISSGPQFALQLAFGSSRSIPGWLLSIPLQFVGIFPVAVSSFAFLFLCPEHLRPVKTPHPGQLAEGRNT